MLCSFFLFVDRNQHRNSKMQATLSIRFGHDNGSDQPIKKDILLWDDA